MAPVASIKLLDGTAIPWLAWGNGTGHAAKNAVDSGKAALKAGFKHIDTAQWYYTEAETGQCITEAGLTKEDVYVTSKLSPLDSKPIKLVDLKTSVQGTIDRLGFHPDLLLIHAPITYEEGQLVPFWKALEAMKDSGELRSSLGVSNFRPQDLNTLLEIAKYKPVVNQIEFHPFVLAHLEPVLAIHEKYGIVTESYGPLTPILRHKATGGPLLPVFDKIIKRLSSEPGVSTSLIDNAAVLLLWCRAKSVVAVTTSGNVERLNNILAVQSLPDLTPEEVKQIDDVGKKYHYRYYSGHMSKEFPHPDLPTGEE